MAFWVKNRNRDIYSEADDYSIGIPEEITETQVKNEKPEGGMLQMIVIRPKEFSDATVIADSLKNGQAVVLNLEDISDDKARRMIDYIAGVIYAIDGKIERPAIRTFLLTPSGVKVATDKN